MADLSITGEVVVTSEKAEGAFDRVGAKAGQMASKVQTEANKASSAIDGIGTGAEAGAEKFTRAESRMRAAIQKSTRELEMLGKTASQKFEAQLDFKGLDKAKFKPFLDELRKAEEATKKAESGLSGLGSAAQAAGRAMAVAFSGAAAVVGIQLVRWAKDAGGALFEASVNAERLRTMLNFSTGNSARDIEYLRGITQKLGLEMQSTATAYGQFAAAAKGTTLEGQKTRDVFESIAKASAVMGLSANQTSGVLLALQQMVSKGTVQAEELRGQLGERLPGAFQVAARAMGVTTGELGKMLEQGQVVADDFLPKFARALNEYVGNAAESAATRLEASQSRMSNAWERLMQAVGDSGISSAMAVGMESAASSIDAIAVAMEAARRSGDGMGGQFLAAAGAAQSLLDPTERLTVNLYDNERASKAAWERLRDLEVQAARGVNVKAEYQQVINLINTLQIARHEMAKLRQEASGVANIGDRPRDLREDNPGLTRGASYARWAKEQADSEQALAAARMRTAGINKQYYADLATYQQALRVGTMTEKEYTEAVSKLATETWKASAAGRAATASRQSGARASDEAAKAAEREAKAFDTFMNSLREKIAAQELELQYGDKLTESDKKRLELEKQVANGRFKLTEARKAEANADLQIMRSNEQELANRKKLIEVIDAQRNSLMEIAKAEAARIDAMGADNSKLRDEIELIGLSSEAQAQLAIAKNNTAIAAKEEQLARLQNANITTREMSALEEEIRVLRERNELLGSKGIRQAQEEARQEAKKTADSINQSLTDALLRGFESGKDFAKNLRDTVVNMFKTMVLRPVISAIINPISHGITGMMGLSGAAQAGQGGGGILGLASNASSAYNLATGGFGSMLFGNSIAYGAMVPGLSMGGAQAAMLAAQTGEFGLAGATATASAGGAGAGGFGALLSNPVTIAIGALAMLGLSGAFSRKHEQHNLQGTFGGATGFEGNWHDYYKGGLFRSSKTVDTPLEADFLKGLQDAWNAQEAAVTSYAQALGLATDSIAGFTYDVNIKLKDLDPKAGDYQQQLMARVADAIKAGSNEMAQQIIGSWDTVQETVTRHVQQFGDDGFSTVEETITRQTYVASEFAREGESAIDTLTRLGSSLQAVNSVFDTLGYTLLSASLASGDLASKLIDAIGGGDAFSQLTATYWQQFYSEGERQATVRRQIEGKLGDIGLAMPATRAEYRAMVEALDLTSEAGRTAFATMMQLAGAFAEVTQSAEEAAQAQAQALRENTDRAWEALQRLYQAQIDNWRKLASEADGIFRLSLDAARRLRGEVAQTVASDAAAGNAYIDSALAALRATGALPDREELSRAIDAARGGLDMSQYGTVAEYERDKLLLAGKLGEIADASGVQMSFAEQQVDLLEKQNNYWRDQIDLLRKTDLSITSIDDGVRYLVDAMKTEQAAKEAAEQAAQEAAEEAARRAMRGGGGPGVWGGGGGGEIPLRTIDWDSGEYWYPDGSGGRLSEEELRFFKDRRDHPERYPFPFYAAGGYYPGGLALVGEQGPELINFASPGHVYTAVQTRDMMRGGDNAELIAELRELRARLDKIERNTAVLPQTHDVIDRVTAGGNAMLTEAA